MEINNKQVGGTHYAAEGLQHWDYMILMEVPYLLAAATKYLIRATDYPLQDVNKSEHYWEKWLKDGSHLDVGDFRELLFEDMCVKYNVSPVTRTLLQRILNPSFQGRDRTVQVEEYFNKRRTEIALIMRSAQEEGDATARYTNQD